MGFTAGFYKYRKHNDIPYEEVMDISSTIGYRYNDWAKKNYSYQDYMCRDCESDGAKDYESWAEDNKENIDWYISHQYRDAYDDKPHMYFEVGSWCSDGANYHEKFQEMAASKYGECSWMYDEQGIKNALKYFTGLLENNFKFYTIENSFNYKYDSDNEEHGYIVTPCDGIEVSDDEGNIRRIEAEYEQIIFSKYDSYQFSTLLNIIETLTKVLTDTNFDEEYVIYNGGW